MRKFDPEAAIALIARHRCTSTFMAPTLLKRIDKFLRELVWMSKTLRHGRERIAVDA